MNTEYRYRRHLIRVIGGFGSPLTFQVFGLRSKNGGRTLISEHASLQAAKNAIDALLTV